MIKMRTAKIIMKNNADKNDPATADESEYSIYPDDYEYMRDNRTDDLTKL